MAIAGILEALRRHRENPGVSQLASIFGYAKAFRYFKHGKVFICGIDQAGFEKHLDFTVTL